MNTFKWVFLGIFVLLVSSNSFSAEKDVMQYWNFYSGTKYLEIGIKNPALISLNWLYIAGLSDGLNRMALNAPDYHWIFECTKEKDVYQLNDIFKRWLDENPKRWDEPASILFMEAVKEACKPTSTTGGKEGLHTDT